MKKVLKSTYFTIGELCASSTAKKLGIDNSPTPEIEKNLHLLIDNVLDPVRKIYGAPIRVTSGYRCPALEQAVSGKVYGQHLQGLAADLQPISGGSLADIFRAVIKHGVWDQLIIEENANGARWVHVSYTPQNRRNQVLAYKNGSYINVKNSWENWI